jgi:hypothetical protein
VVDSTTPIPRPFLSRSVMVIVVLSPNLRAIDGCGVTENVVDCNDIFV